MTLCTGVYKEPPFWVQVSPSPLPPRCLPFILKSLATLLLARQFVQANTAGYLQFTPSSFALYFYQMLTKGLYSVHALEWMRAYPRDQLMFIRFEDWYKKCREILPDIFKFLEIGKECSNDLWVHLSWCVLNHQFKSISILYIHGYCLQARACTFSTTYWKQRQVVLSLLNCNVHYHTCIKGSSPNRASTFQKVTPLSYVFLLINPRCSLPF